MEHRTVADPVLKVISWVGSGCRSMAANCHSLPTLLVRLALLRHRLPILETPAQLMYRPRSDRKSTRLNSSHRCISYAVFCLKKKKKNHNDYHNITNKQH